MTGRDALGSLCVVLLCCLVACGGDDDGGSTSSGVDSSKTLDEVTVDEAMDFCEWEGGLVEDDFIRLSCFLAAIVSSENLDDCEALAQECIDDPSSSMFELECDLDPDSFNDDLPACASDITVGELEDCISSFADVFGDLADQISCDNFPTTEPDPPAACTDLEEQCPDLFDFSGNAALRRPKTSIRLDRDLSGWRFVF